MKTEGRKQEAGGRRKQAEGSKQRLGFGLGAGLALMVCMATMSYGRPRRSTTIWSDPTITVRVYNYAGASEGDITNAEKEAGYVLDHAGVKVIWWDCVTHNNEPICSEVIGPYNLTLRVLPGEPKNKPGLHEDTLGVTTATLASVYPSRVNKLAESIGEEQGYATLLGDAMAHEIGHVLLGPSHSQTGIMQAHWEPESLRRGIMSLLHFTPEQATELRIHAHKNEEAVRGMTRANASRLR